MRQIVRVFLTTLITVTLLTLNLQPVFAVNYGFDYKFLTGVAAPRDPETFTTSSTSSIQAKEPTLNGGRLLYTDITTLTKSDYDLNYSDSVLSKATTRMIEQTNWRDDFNDSLTRWDSLSDFFTYEVKGSGSHKYVVISVKDFSQGIDLGDLFDMSDFDVLELNTDNSHGYSIDVLAREGGSTSIALMPTVEYPGQFEALVGNSVVVIVRSYENQPCTPITLASNALAGSINSILNQSEVLKETDNGQGMLMDLPSNVSDFVPGVDNAAEEQDSASDIINPVEFVTEANHEANDGEVEDVGDFFEQFDDGMYDSYLDVANDVSSSINDYYQESSTNNNTVISQGQGITVYYNGEKKVISEVPDGYYLSPRTDGDYDLVKRELDVSGLQFGTSWGIAERPSGDNLKKITNVETSGNTLLKNVSLQMRTNVDTLTKDTIRTFYTKPLPQRFHLIGKSDRIVIIHGGYNWIISLCLFGTAAIVALLYFISLHKYVSNRIKDLKKMALIRDSELASEIDAVDVRSMTL